MILYALLPVLFRFKHILKLLWTVCLVVGFVFQIASYICGEPVQKHFIQIFRLWTWVQYFVSQDELLPQAFAYKILKKLEKAGLVEVVRGTAGGCRLSADLTGTSLYDLMKAMGERGNLSSCMDPAYQCPWRSCHGGCTVHCKLAEIQNKLDEELRAHSLQEILTDP